MILKTYRCFSFFSLFILFNTAVFSQQHYYYSNGDDKTLLTEIESLWLVHFKNGVGNNAHQISGEQLIGDYYAVTNTNNLSTYFTNYAISSAFLNVGDTLYESDEIVLWYKSSTSAAQKNNLVEQYDLTFIKETDFYIRYFSDNALADAAAIYESGLVEYSHPNFFTKAKSLSHIPNDPYFNKQFGLHNTGQVINDGNSGTADADIDAPEAWDITKGDSNVVVAIIDKGLTANHVDLPNSRQVRLPGGNLSASLSGNSADSLGPTAAHGEHCAGIVAAEQDNNIGVSGVAPKSKIMPVKYETSGLTTTIWADCFAFADSNNAPIISGSFGFGRSIIPAVETVLERAHKNNRIMFIAAGNSRGSSAAPPGQTPDPNGTIEYPALSPVPSVIAVGASDRNDKVATYSVINELIDIVAPSSKAMGTRTGTDGPDVW